MDLKAFIHDNFLVIVSVGCVIGAALSVLAKIIYMVKKGKE